MFDQLRADAPDPLLSLIALHQADPRPDTIDLGVGVYRDAHGRTPVLAAVKQAERTLAQTQPSKAYLGTAGNTDFLDSIRLLVFGENERSGKIVSVQTPGGTGALRLAADLTRRADPAASVVLGLPSWPIHASIFAAAGLRMVTFEAFDTTRQAIRFDAVLDAIRRAGRDHLVLLHGCCHNPTGADFTAEQWATIADALAHTGAVPLIDLAYHGFGEGMRADLHGLSTVIERVPRAMVAYSCDKNFGLYRERTGALFVLCGGAEEAGRVASATQAIARALWSMPPDHGAAVVATILSDPDLSASWRGELEDMRLRLHDVRQALALAGELAGVDLSAVRMQRGLFSLLSLRRKEAIALRERFGIYMAESGRINLAGLDERSCLRFAQAVRAVIA